MEKSRDFRAGESDCTVIGVEFDASCAATRVIDDDVVHVIFISRPPAGRSFLLPAAGGLVYIQFTIDE